MMINNKYADIQKTTILIVDDIPGQRETIADFLEEHGYETYTAANGESAIKALQDNPASAAIVDIKLPDTSGEKLAVRLNQINPDLEIILMTGYASVDTAIGAVKSGVSAYLTKPLDLDLLLAELTRAIEHRRLVLNNRQLLEDLKQELAERKRMEEELLKLRKLESLGVLAGGIAHDFNNFLTVILGNISYARMDTDNGSQAAEAIAEAEKACSQAQKLTQQLLTFSRGGEPVKELLRLDKVIKETTRFVLHGSNVNCRFEIEKDLWPVEADKGQIGQVMSNLVINANQAMAEGGEMEVGAVNVELEDGEIALLPGGRYVKVMVKDRGIGITEEHLKKIFDPYFTTKQKGSGLGLATAYSIVTKHSGMIRAESEPGRGTVFSLYLPAAREKPGEEEVRGDVIMGKGNVLLMDDDDDIRKLAGLLLKGLGYQVQTAADGEEAIAKFVKAQKTGKPFAAVILDLTVRGRMGGMAALKILKEIDPTIRAIVSSGYSTDSVMANHKKHGFSGVIVKPYRVEDFSRVLRNVIGNTGDSTQIHTDRNTDTHRSPSHGSP